MDMIMFLFNILKLKLFPLCNFCGFTCSCMQSIIGSEGGKKKADFNSAGLSGFCRDLPVDCQPKHLQFPLLRIYCHSFKFQESN